MKKTSVELKFSVITSILKKIAQIENVLLKNVKEDVKKEETKAKVKIKRGRKKKAA